jgi:uncharacterized membrane protein
MSYASPDTDVTSDDKLWALLAYLIPVIIPLIILLTEDRKNRAFQRVAAVQSLAITVISVILGSFTLGIVSCLLYIYQIYMAVMAYQGKTVSIPWLSNFMTNQHWM